MATQRPLDDLGPEFEQRWKDAEQDDRRAVLTELRDLYIMLEKEDTRLAARPGKTGALPAGTDNDIPLLVPAAKTAGQGNLFSESPANASPPPPRKDNPFLPASVLARLQESQTRVSAGMRDLVQDMVDKSFVVPLTPRQAELERELRLRTGPIVEGLIEAQLDTLKSELRVRLRAEMDRLIAELVRKQG
jgi:hypothetical protein